MVFVTLVFIKSVPFHFRGWIEHSLHPSHVHTNFPMIIGIHPKAENTFQRRNMQLGASKIEGATQITK